MHDIFATVCEFFRTSGPTGLFWNSFIESFFLVPPPDILLGMMTLSEPQKAVYFATLCTLASALGGIVGYFIGYFGGRPIFNFFFRNNHSQFEKVEAFYDKYGSAAVFFAAFTPIPYKVFTIASGVLNMNLAAFSAASIVGRGMRFFIVALGLMFFGEAVKRYLEPTIFVVTILALVVFLFWYHRKVVKKKQ
ncbi:MAG: YqaA family protein [Candidatus Gastranaerophilaceae bacterium]